MKQLHGTCITVRVIRYELVKEEGCVFHDVVPEVSYIIETNFGIHKGQFVRNSCKKFKLFLEKPSWFKNNVCLCSLLEIISLEQSNSLEANGSLPS
jgi:hypothetical protein